MSSASTASSSTKKVEWYHLDRVAIAKRICLDPAAVKLKTALNNNNNNNTNNNNYAGSIATSSHLIGPALKSAKSGVVGSANNNVSGSSANNSTSTNSNKTSTPFDIHRLLAPRPTVVKEAFVTGNNTSSTASRSGGGHGTVVDGHPGTKGIFSVRYSTTAGSTNTSTTTKPTTIPSFLTSSAGSRQFAALQQKRRRKAARLALAEQQKQQQQEQQQKEAQVKELTQCKRFLDEESIIVNVATSVGSSCGSSSRSSSSGVSSDFEETDTASASTFSNMKVANAGSRGVGCQSSSSECEDEDEESSPAAIVTGPATFGSATSKVCKNSTVSDGVKNNNNLNSLGILNSLVSSGGGSVSVVGKGSMMMMSKTGRVPEMSRIVNGKVIAHHKNVVSVVGGHIKAVHSSNKNSNDVAHGVVVKSKVENGSSTTSSRISNGSSKHHASTTGSTKSHSSASSTSSGSTDNDRDTDNSFSEFPTDLDFMGMPDKGKRRTDRYDSSESSDSGVATLSPSTSDSPELISTCCDFTSDHLDVGNLISRSSSTSSYPTSNSSKFSSSSASSSSSSGTSSSSSKSSTPSCLPQSQGEPSTGTVSTTSIKQATLPSSSSSTGSDANSLATNPPVQDTLTLCMWAGCTCSTEASHNILEHIQTTHVATQMKTAGYVCLWEGCKVFNKRSSSLSWLERHVLTHGGSKPFKCIFPGCGLSFSSQNTLERHVNSHIATNGTTNGAQGNSTVANKKVDASPAKSSRRKKARFRKQRINIGQRVDFFDKRVMEVIKHWLSKSVDQYAVNAHDCTFMAEIVAKRVITDCERQVLVRWHPRFVFPDEWVPESKFSKIKLVPLRRIPPDKIRLLYPALFPPPRQEKASRKRKPPPRFLPPSPSTTPAPSEGNSSLSTIPPSPTLSPSEIQSLMDTDPFMISNRSTRSSSSSSASLCSNSSSSTTSSSSTNPPSSSSQNSHQNSSASNSSTIMTMDTCSGILNSELEQEEDEDKCHKQFCGSLECDCPSALLDDEDPSSEFESSHWALDLFYEDMGISPS